MKNTIDYEKFSNNDGTYTSPKNGKVYKSKTAFIAHWHNSGTGGFSNINSDKIRCVHCGKQTTRANIGKHEDNCYLNTSNLKKCPICSKPIKNYKTSTTCGYSCSNSYFKNLRNTDKRLGYQALCFRYHKKECIVCGENKIVAAHHVNEDHSDNRPENLVPLCPTHHQYVHSRYRDEVQPLIDQYLNQYKYQGVV